MTILIGDTDAYFHLQKAELHLKEAESRLFLEDVDLAEEVREIREKLSKLLDNYGRVA